MSGPVRDQRDAVVNRNPLSPPKFSLKGYLIRSVERDTPRNHLEGFLIRSVERDTPKDPLECFLNRSVEKGATRGFSDQKCGEVWVMEAI